MKLGTLDSSDGSSGPFISHSLFSCVWLLKPKTKVNEQKKEFKEIKKIMHREFSLSN